MKVRAERVGSAFLLELGGRLTIEADTHQLSAAVGEILQLDVSDVVLDLANVDQLDCSGIGLLLQLHNQVRESGRNFILINVDSRVQHLLQRAGLLAVFPVFSCLRDAMMCREHTALQVCDQASRPFEGATDTTRRELAGILPHVP